MVKPYYQEDGITIYHGDCREVLPYLPGVDAVLTDPPYGIGADAGVGKYGRLRNYEERWDSSPAEVLFLLKLSCPIVIWGGNYFPLPPSRCYFVWDKAEGFKGRDFAECELAWCSFDANAKIFKYDPLANGDYKGKEHPTQKPIALMKWCIGQLPIPTLSILDPYMGSGSTLAAAKDWGKCAVGIDLEEKYCEIAANRLRQSVLNFT